MASASVKYLYSMASNNLGISNFSDEELTESEKARNIRKFRDARVGGLYNEGNTCFANSVVQALASCDPIAQYTEDNKHDLNFSGALNDIITNLNQIHTRQHGYSTLRLMRQIGGERWNIYDQEDAQEFFQELLNTLEKDHKALVARASAESDVPQESEAADDSIEKNETENTKEKSKEPERVTPFDGECAVRVGCLRCGDMEGIRKGVLSSVDLGLEMATSRVSLYSLLSNYTAMETIPGVECYRCSLLAFKDKVQEKLTDVRETGGNSLIAAALEKRIADVETVLKEKVIDEKRYNELKYTSHKVQSDKTKQTMFARPNPDVLMIHINRSVFDLRTGIVRKNFAPVDFPAVLDLAPYTTDPKDPTNADPHYSMKGLPSGEKELYNLKAAVVHYGSANFGHYVSFRKFHGFWWRISDHQVDLTTEAQVLGAQGVFMLFYERDGLERKPEKQSDIESELQRAAEADASDVDNNSDENDAVNPADGEIDSDDLARDSPASLANESD